MILRTVQAFKKNFTCRSNRKNSLFRFCNFTMVVKAEKKRLLKHSEVNSFINTVVEIDIDALKI